MNFGLIYLLGEVEVVGEYFYVEGLMINEVVLIVGGYIYWVDYLCVFVMCCEG